MPGEVPGVLDQGQLEPPDDGLKYFVLEQATWVKREEKSITFT